MIGNKFIGLFDGPFRTISKAIGQHEWKGMIGKHRVQPNSPQHDADQCTDTRHNNRTHCQLHHRAGGGAVIALDANDSIVGNNNTIPFANFPLIAVLGLEAVRFKQTTCLTEAGRELRWEREANGLDR
jgi:hypothetical protein